MKILFKFEVSHQRQSHYHVVQAWKALILLKMKAAEVNCTQNESDRSDGDDGDGEQENSS